MHECSLSPKKKIHPQDDHSSRIGLGVSGFNFGGTDVKLAHVVQWICPSECPGFQGLVPYAELGSYRPQRGVGVVLRTVPRIGIASFIEPPGRERTSLGVRRRFRGLLAPQSVDGAECGTLASL